MSNVVSMTAHPKRSIPTTAVEVFRTLCDARIEDMGRPSSFHLRRGKGCSEVWVVFDGCPRLSVNMSVHLKHWPKNFAEARQWMQATFPGVPEGKPR